MKKILMVCLLLMSQQAYAGELYPKWLKEALKKDNPNILAISLSACPITFSWNELNNIVEGVMIRSRIKPDPDSRSNWSNGETYLSVSLFCARLFNSNQFNYNMDIGFGRVNAMGDIDVMFDWGYDSMGIGDKASITAHIKRQVERAMTDYIKANFNL